MCHPYSDLNIYLNTLFDRLIKYFDVKRNVIQHNEAFDLYAYHRRDFFKSFLTRSTVYEGFSLYEYILVRTIKYADEKIILDFQNGLKDITTVIVNPNKFHKKTTIIGVLVVEEKVSDNIAKHARKFFFRKTYKFSFRGWSETQMAIVSLNDKKLYYPKHLKELNKLLNV